MYDPSLFSRILPPRYSSSQIVRTTYSATTILVLGICAVTICPLCAPFAWYMGTQTLRVMEDENLCDNATRTLVEVGRILGIIGTALIALGLLLFLMLRF